MGDISRIRSVWSGFPGAPGVTTMYFVDTATAVPSIKAFWEAIKGYLPTEVSIHVENAGDTLESTTGALTGAWTDASVPDITGTGNDSYAAPAGACINWNTETIGPHRRLRGRTFVVPLDQTRYENDGSLNDACLAGLLAAANTFIGEQSASFVVWHRGTGSDGLTGLVTSATVHDMVAILRSRRD